jgi:hypothetical protein
VTKCCVCAETVEGVKVCTDENACPRVYCMKCARGSLVDAFMKPAYLFQSWVMTGDIEALWRFRERCGGKVRP